MTELAYNAAWRTVNLRLNARRGLIWFRLGSLEWNPGPDDGASILRPDFYLRAGRNTGRHRTLILRG
jgi:hypothetical protein